MMEILGGLAIICTYGGLILGFPFGVAIIASVLSNSSSKIAKVFGMICLIFCLTICNFYVAIIAHALLNIIDLFDTSLANLTVANIAMLNYTAFTVGIWIKNPFNRQSKRKRDQLAAPPDIQLVDNNDGVIQ